MRTHESFKTESVHDIDTQGLLKRLRDSVEGEIRFGAGDRAMYSTDASNYRQIPIGIVLPKSEQDILNTVSVCREFGVPLLSRGGATSLAGQTCNVAVVQDMSKYLHRVLEIDPRKQTARVQPGAILDDLRKQAARYHLTFGPDPATHTHCTLGGMIGNNSCGIHAQMAGRTTMHTADLFDLAVQTLNEELRSRSRRFEPERRVRTFEHLH